MQYLCIVLKGMKTSLMKPKSTFLKMACEEPFRAFFPLGLLAGVSGVMLWPLYFSGIYSFYPGLMHSRLMVEGFLGAFIFGFLATAGPRLTGTPHLSRGELISFLVLYGATLGAHIAGRTWLGDTLFLSLLLTYASRMGLRFTKRDDLPPPGFVLVGLGFLAAIAGAGSLAASEIGGEHGIALPETMLVGGTLLNQVWVLLLVLGVGSFLLPKFLELPDRPQFPESRTPTPGWAKHAVFAAAVGLSLVALSMLDLFVYAPRLIAFGRFGIAVAFLFTQIPLHRTTAPRVTITRCLHLAMLLALLGLLFPVAWPFQRVAGLHVLFIGGFTLITLTVATRVILGHSGFGKLFSMRLPFLFGAALLLVSAMVLRSGADFILPWRGGAINAAAYCWVAGAALWAWRVLPKVRITDSE
jgi:uncharacterized protein involved in response to NO